MESWIRGNTIGRGSYGTVSLAVNESTGGVFAVKSVERNSCLPRQLEALENEIRILKKISSPYIVKYLGDGVTVEDNTCFSNLYLEYLPGGTVADLARARKFSGAADVDEKIIRNYAFCIVSAINYLHSKGIVHCDIKCDNILVGPDTRTAKLVDFGSSMEISPRGSGNCKILPRGSPLWMAPEVIRGEYQGKESDVWSLGCAIIEMITGKPAWEDKGAAETLCRIGYSDELPAFPAQLSDLGRDFLEKCLRRDYNKRWSSDQLLNHPFISPGNLVSNSSPRCILDWFSLDSDEEDELEESVFTKTTFPLFEERNKDEEISIPKLTDRIRELASDTGANWESDGWVVVRSWESSDGGGGGGSCRRSSCSSSREEEEVGTSSAYSELSGVESEINGVKNPDDSDSIEIGEVRSRRTNVEYFRLHSNRSLYDVVTLHQQGRNFLVLIYLLSNFSKQNSTICSQIAILFTYITNFLYILYFHLPYALINYFFFYFD